MEVHNFTSQTSGIESAFTARKLLILRERFAAEETLDDRRAMEIIVEEIFGDEESGNFDDETIDRTIQKLFFKTRRRLGILQPLLEDDCVTEIMVNGPEHIFAERQGKIQKWPLSFDSGEELTEIIRAAIPMKVQVTGGHPAKRTFQAIRIELNKELEVLQNNLDDMIDLLNPGGRICIITFHSLEDRIVKTIFKKNENPCTCPSDFPVCVCGKKSKGSVVGRKPILPSQEELEMNSRSKSAKLRVFERA